LGFFCGYGINVAACEQKHDAGGVSFRKFSIEAAKSRFPVIVRGILLYDCEVWSLNSSDCRRMNVYGITLLGTFLNVVGVKVFHVYFTTAKSCQCVT